MNLCVHLVTVHVHVRSCTICVGVGVTISLCLSTDTIYTERYMNEPEDNPVGYAVSTIM